MTNEQFLEKITTVENVNSFARKKRNKYNLKSVSISENNIEFDQFWMRKDNNVEKFLSDEILKENWLLEIGKNNIMCVFDDRTKIVNMWRRNGVTCFQVADGNF